MLQQIHIQNFRCFEDFKAEGFERVNLIGGKNNSGKSCLLEGVYTALSTSSIKDIATIRNQSIIDLINVDVQQGSIIKSFKIEFEFDNNYSEYRCDYNSVDNLIERSTDVETIITIDRINYISQKTELPKINFVGAFDNFSIKNLKPRILEIIHKIDNTIIDFKSYSSKGNTLYVSKMQQEDKPITSFGDATYNILKYFTPIFQKIVDSYDEISVLLIDEIENGIHYTAHEKFWQHLFKLCKELNVQVFATTHSLEMIKAFNAVALKEGEGAYFEMMREEANNKIEILKHSPSILQEEMELKEPKFRGEEFKNSIDLATDLMETLNQASAQAREQLKVNNIAVPYIEDGWIWQLMPNGEKVKLEKLKAIK